MTLLTYPDVVQGSEEWHTLRRGIVTASTIGALITPKTIKLASNDDSRGLTMLLASERITGWTYPTYQSADMLRGTLDEPIARDLYSRTYAAVTEMGFMVREFDDGSRVGFSPDGLVGKDGMLEIKSRRPRQHVETILADAVPLGNMVQIQCGLFVTGRDWCDYVSFSGGLPMWTKRVTPDLRWREAIVLALAEFEANVSDIVNRYAEAVQGLPSTERIDHFAEAAL